MSWQQVEHVLRDAVTVCGCQVKQSLVHKGTHGTLCYMLNPFIILALLENITPGCKQIHRLDFVGSMLWTGVLQPGTASCAQVTGCHPKGGIADLQTHSQDMTRHADNSSANTPTPEHGPKHTTRHAESPRPSPRAQPWSRTRRPAQRRFWQPLDGVAVCLKVHDWHARDLHKSNMA